MNCLCLPLPNRAVKAILLGLAYAWLCHDQAMAADPAHQPARQSTIREGRAFWNHSGAGAYPGDWDRSAKELARAGFNMILPNMLWVAAAHYPSDVVPPSPTFQRHGDQMTQCLAAAKKYGLEVHVWTVAYRLSKAPKQFVDQMQREGRTQVSAAGKGHAWLCPSHPENIKIEVDSLADLVRNYDVDGLHLDYIRYPNGDYCYCNGCRKRFEADTGKNVDHWPADCYSGGRRAEYRRWRCKQITKLVVAAGRECKRVRPELKLSAAVFGSYPDCREAVGQDWVAWAHAGYVDFLCPMDYTDKDLYFQWLVKTQLRQVAGKVLLYPGIGAASTNSKLSARRVLDQIREARSLGTSGFTIFNLTGETAATLLPEIGRGIGAKKAIPPHTHR